MKKININKDVESRRNIAARKPAVQPIVKPTKSDKSDAKSEKIQGAEADTTASPTKEPTPKRTRTTKGNAQTV